MLTVLMATHNGSDTLPAVLAAYCELQPPPGRWKLVIVDNASTDATKQVIESFSSRLPLTYLLEPRIGKNVALNTGLRMTEGDLVVFTDDDALPRSDWLVQARAVADSQPSFAIFGGTIVPQWEVSPPDWILPFQFPTLTITSPDWEEGPSLPGRVWGPNMVIRAEALHGRRFAESMGPTGSRYQMGDETEFVDRLVAAGFKVWHSKRMVVSHMIRASQMRKEWVLRRAVAAGRADYRRGVFAAPKRIALLLGFPRYLVRQIIEQVFRVGWSKLFRDDITTFEDRWRLSYLIAQALEGRIVHKSFTFEGVPLHGSFRRLRP
jgi:glycosyltransferase involved in cell wall biosynthesis